MRGPNALSLAHKKLDSQNLKKSKTNLKKEKSSSKIAGAPKRPLGAFFVFMEEFRKTYKENFPDNKSITVVGIAGGEKWKSMPDSEKAPYNEKAAKRKADYEKAMEAFNKKINGNREVEQAVESDNSTSDVHDDEKQEVSG